ncbi:hypothetical protein DFH06DRAFT_1389901 [Mycena polygramma]|nr:hypothetical protein DFH06DRAFT_1389901 [Mycena polygramma]
MPDLPSELEREIFELAYRCSGREPTLKRALCLVARRVKYCHAERFLNLIGSNLKQPNLLRAIKTLCVPYAVAAANAGRILEACSEVESLACWVDCTYDLRPLDLLSQLPLLRLSIEAHHFSNTPVSTSTWLSRLTHIELFAWRNYDASELYKLGALPRLTHVALSTLKMGSEHAAIVCSCCLILQILVLLKDAYDDQKPVFRYDPRVVVQDAPEDLIGDWEASYFGRPDMWYRAEAALKQQNSLVAAFKPLSDAQEPSLGRNGDAVETQED